MRARVTRCIEQRAGPSEETRVQRDVRKVVDVWVMIGALASKILCLNLPGEVGVALCCEGRERSR